MVALGPLLLRGSRQGVPCTGKFACTFSLQASWVACWWSSPSRMSGSRVWGVYMVPATPMRMTWTCTACRTL